MEIEAVVIFVLGIVCFILAGMWVIADGLNHDLRGYIKRLEKEIEILRGKQWRNK